MKRIKMTIKMIGIILGSLITLVLVVGIVFINFSPEFGEKATKEQKEEYKKSGHYEEDKFVNEQTTNMDMGFLKGISIMREFTKNVADRQPKNSIAVDKIDSLEIVQTSPKVSKVTWFGHSAFLLEIQGKKILIDPMLGEVPAPHPLLGSPRFNEELPISIEKLPKIDIVIISHDHYDHLDYGSIKKLMSKVDQFYMPLGVGNHLKEWGVDLERIHELNWWDEIKHDDLKLVCTPSRHFSGRGLFDRAATLWGSWIIQSDSLNLFFSGDGGYGPHFKEIGEKYGPFDFAMMECGQYNENWSEIHMMPEETAQASVDVNANLMMPIHWGAFKLALHSWTDPVERLTIKAAELNVNMITPRIGQTFELLPTGEDAFTSWWTSVE